MSIGSPSDPMEGHTAKAFDGALTELRLHAVGMGGLVIDQVSTAVRALLEADANLAQTVLARESQVNDLERAVDREAFQLIALHQPVAGDLRMATSVSRISVELERAGDESKKIARFAARERRAARAGARGRPLPAAHGGADQRDVA
jgi:phosphate transport system protein